jgi:hypothetical protein
MGGIIAAAGNATMQSPAALGVDVLWDGAGISESGGSVSQWAASIGTATNAKVGAGTLTYTASWRGGKPSVTIASGTRLETSGPGLTGTEWTYLFVGQVPASHPTTAYGPMSANIGKPFPILFWDAGANVDVRTSPDGSNIYNTAPGLNLLDKAVAIIVRVKANSQRMRIVVDGGATDYSTTGALVHAQHSGSALGDWYGGGGNMTGGKIALFGIWDRELADSEASSLGAWCASEFAL